MRERESKRESQEREKACSRIFHVSDAQLLLRKLRARRMH